MELFHRKKKFDCENCDEAFTEYDQFIEHEKSSHNREIIRCECGMRFLHEKDRLHHSREEHKKELKSREHRKSYPGEYPSRTQERVDAQKERFSDNL